MQKHALCILLACCLAGSAEGLTQPDISAIGDFRVFTGNWKNADGSRTPRHGNFNMAFSELEIAVSGYLNPYAKGWVTVSSPGDGFEIEEAHATIFKGLPFRSELRAGKFLVDFGRLNTSHAHAFSFVDRPIAQRVLFGTEGFVDQGINWNFLLPTSVYSKVSLNVLRGDIFAGEDAPDDPLVGRNTERPIFAGRWNVFVPLGERGDVDVGVSGLWGPYKGRGAYGTGDQASGFRNLYATMFGADLKYKIRWDDYTSLVLQGEVIGNRRDVFADRFTVNSNFGFFAFADYRFRKRYNVGLLYDRAPGIYDNTEDDYEQNVAEEQSNTSRAALDTENSTTAVTLFAGFSLLEETTLIRLAGQWKTFSIADAAQLIDPAVTSKAGEFTLVLQLIWSLGPHKPHEF